MVESTSTSRTYLKILYVAIMFFYGWYCMGVSINSSSKFSDLRTEFDELTKNWETDVITDVKVATANSNSCPTNYEPLFSYEFEGTMAGCDCRSVSLYNQDKYNVESQIYSNQCSRNQTLAGGSDIAAIQSKKFQRFTTQTNGVIMCVKRLKGYKFTKKFIKYSDGGVQKCTDSNDRVCGTNKATAFCVLSSEQCPVTRIALSNSSLSNYTTLTPQALYDYKNVYIQRNGSGAPLIEGMISNGQVCKLNENKNINPATSDSYELLEEKRTQCTDYDLRWSSFNQSMTEPQFFDVNGYKSNLEALPGFGTLNSNAIYTQYYRTQLSWQYTKECRGSLEEIVKGIDNFKSMSSMLTGLMVFNIIAALFFSIILTGMELANLCGYDLPCVDGEKEEEAGTLRRWKKYGGYIVKFVQLPFMIATLVSAISLKGIYVDLGCSDSITNATMANIQDSIKKHAYNGIITQITMLILFILYDACMAYITDAKKEAEDEKARKKKRQMANMDDLQRKAAIELQNQQQDKMQQQQAMQMTNQPQMMPQQQMQYQQQPQMMQQQGMMQPQMMPQYQMQYQQQPQMMQQQGIMQPQMMQQQGMMQPQMMQQQGMMQPQQQGMYQQPQMMPQQQQY